MKTNILVTHSIDYSDEFTMEGFNIVTVGQWVALLSKMQKLFDSGATVDVFFGSNQYITIGPGGTIENMHDFMETVTVAKISEAKSRYLIKTLELKPTRYYEFGSNILRAIIDESI